MVEIPGDDDGWRLAPFLNVWVVLRCECVKTRKMKIEPENIEVEMLEPHEGEERSVEQVFSFFLQDEEKCDCRWQFIEVGVGFAQPFTDSLGLRPSTEDWTERRTLR